MFMALQMTWQNIHRRKSPPLGLKNLGNTCYLNSVLQCLTYTPPLANFCLKNQHSSICQSSNMNRKHDCPFCLLERRIVRSLSIEGPQDVPSKIQNSLQIFAKHFRVGRQEDAHEFLHYVIDACHNTCLKLLKASNQGKHLTGHGNGVAERVEASTVVKEIFGGVLKSQVKCLSCGTESNKMDDIMDISLDLFQSSSLKEALHRFFQAEVLDGSNKYNCEKCTKLSPARKQMFVLRAPNVLVIQLKRFEGVHGMKIDRLITFEEVLVLSSYMCKESQDLQPEYSLFGSIVHSGYSAESGHYYAYIKDGTGRWYCCNDSHVSPATPHEVLSEKVYILFFVRANQRPRPTKGCYTSNGLKSLDCNGINASGNQKESGPLRPNLEKDISTVTKISNVPSKSKIKFGSMKVAPVESKRVDANGNCHLKVNSGALREKNGGFEESAVKKTEALSISNCNGVVANKSSDAMMPDTKQSLLVAGNGNTKNMEKLCLKLKKSESLTSNDKENVVGASRGSDSNPASNDVNRKHHSDLLRSKRKSCEIETVTAFSGPCKSSRKNSWSKGKYDTSELEKFKDMISKEASSYLRSCGFSREVEEFMKSRKRSCEKLVGSSCDSNELKNVLIGESKEKFYSQLPESLKGDLVRRIRLFICGKE